MEDPNFHSVYVLTNRFDVPKYYSIECPIGFINILINIYINLRNWGIWCSNSWN